MTRKNRKVNARGSSGGARTTPRSAAAMLVAGVVVCTLLLSVDVLVPGAMAGWTAGSVAPRTVFSGVEASVVGPEGATFALQRGQAVVRGGDVISSEQEALLRYLERVNPPPVASLNVAGNALLTLLLVLALGLCVLHIGKPILKERVNALLLLSVLLASVGVVKGLGHMTDAASRATALAVFNPIPTAVLVTTIFLSRELGIAASVVLSVLLLGISPSANALLAGTSLMAGMVAAHAVSRQDSDRSDVLKAGMSTGFVSALAMLALGLIERSQTSTSSFGVLFGNPALGLANGAVTAVAVLGLMPLLENSFNVITSTKLQELLNPNQPLLQKLVREAPGTYHHSVNVAALAEAAAEEIGADPVLAKAGAYYHDLGKTKRPYFFIENQMGGVNYHDNLSPHLSRLIIHSHTKDGVEIARKHNVPKCITDIMLEHHGTDLVAYFFHRAREGKGPELQEVREETFRYGGPKPQTREAAIVMMCDGVEAASRTLKRPTPSSIESLVAKIINDRFADGQFDECDITKRDLELIQARISKTLTSMFHNRISYPQGFQLVEEEDEAAPPEPRLAEAGR